MNKDDLEEALKCEICGDILYQPMTLLCQHTFCHHCLELGKSMKTLKECPLCKLKLEIPVKAPRNNLISEIEKIIYGQDYFQTIEERIQEETLHRKLEPQVRKEIQEAFQKTLNQSKKEDYKNININLEGGNPNPNNNSNPNSAPTTTNNSQNPVTNTSNQSSESFTNNKWTVKDITNTLETLVFVFYAYNYFGKIIPVLNTTKAKILVYSAFFFYGLYLVYQYFQIKKKPPHRPVQTYSFSYVMPLDNLNNVNSVNNVNNLSQSIANSLQNLIQNQQ